MRTLVLLLCFALPMLDAQAQKPRAVSPLEIQDTPTEDAAVYQGASRINARTSAPEALYQVGFQASPGTPEAMAREYLSANASLLQLSDPALSDLTHVRTQRSLVGHVSCVYTAL
jgi:hypothetical protein